MLVGESPSYQHLEQEVKGSCEETSHDLPLSRRYGVGFREEVHQGEENSDRGAGNT